MTFPSGQTILNSIVDGFFKALGFGLFGLLIVTLKVADKLHIVVGG
jgi:hypothetical protein